MEKEYKLVYPIMSAKELQEKLDGVVTWFGKVKLVTYIDHLKG